MTDCVFCKIIAGKIPSQKLHNDDQFVCIRDIHPQSKVHLLVIPKKHLVSLESAFPENENGEVELIGNLMKVATHVARQQGLLPGGFRTVLNTGTEGGQTVFHLHAHVMGGGRLTERLG